MRGLSLQRADSVPAALIQDGVSASEITAHGFGESLEPQNRRVEIVFR